MKMKKSKENIRQWFLYLSSFLVVSIVTIIIVLLILNKNNTPITLSNSNVIGSLSNAYDSTVYIESTEDEDESSVLSGSFVEAFSTSLPPELFPSGSL